jgi:hypothetical protein
MYVHEYCITYLGMSKQNPDSVVAPWRIVTDQQVAEDSGHPVSPAATKLDGRLLALFDLEAYPPR